MVESGRVRWAVGGGIIASAGPPVPAHLLWKFDETMNEIKPLSASDHSRDAAGLRYVYPVVSRRAGGVSIGVNLNTNNACNWACIYCQVPDLKRGGPPPIDLALLAAELSGFIHDLLHGDFMQIRVPEGARRIVDVAISGNGEPTTAAEFPEVVSLIGQVLAQNGLAGQVIPRLITNGSQLGRERVQEGLARLGELGGETWFKLDAGSAERMAVINGIAVEPDVTLRRLQRCAELCPTWIQTCVLSLDGHGPSPKDLNDYLVLLRRMAPIAQDVRADSVSTVRSGLQGVLLYGLARQSCQPDALRLAPLSGDELDAIAESIRQTGWPVRVSP